VLGYGIRVRASVTSTGIELKNNLGRTSCRLGAKPIANSVDPGKPNKKGPAFAKGARSDRSGKLAMKSWIATENRWAEGIGRQALVYIVSLFEFIIWIGLAISWLFFHGVRPPIVSGG
jgi:hypothetical protein